MPSDKHLAHRALWQLVALAHNTHQKSAICPAASCFNLQRSKPTATNNVGTWVQHHLTGLFHVKHCIKGNQNLPRLRIFTMGNRNIGLRSKDSDTESHPGYHDTSLIGQRKIAIEINYAKRISKTSTKEHSVQKRQSPQHASGWLQRTANHHNAIGYTLHLFNPPNPSASYCSLTLAQILF